jgi:hypothetical protein
VGRSVADDFGPGGVYANIPRLDSNGRPQLPMFVRWNSDPVGNDASNLAALSPGMQKVIAQARADNPDLNFVIGNGKRSAADQDQAKAWGWSRVGSKDGGDANVHMQGNAVDLWGLDSNGHVQFDPDQQKQISQAMQDAAKKVGVSVNWGGNWKSFKDAPHFELAGGGSAASSGAPEGPPAQTPAPPTQSTPGTTINSTAAQPPNTSAIIDTLGRNIAGIESSGWKNPYEALNPTTHAIGKYQVMPANVAGWTQAALGHSMTPEEFKANPQAQEAVFRDQMQRNLQLYGPKDAASIWFTGKPFNVAGGAVKDAVGTTNANYVARATAGLDGGATFTPSQAPGPIDPSIIARGGTSPPIPGTTINGAPAAAPDVAGAFPGFTTKAASDDFTKNATALDKAMHGDQGPSDEEGKAAAFNFLPARNVSPLLGAASQIYGNTLTSLATPAQWSSAAPGQNPYANVGGAPIGGQFGTQLGSMQQLQQMMAMMGNPYGDAGYG